MLLVNQLSEWFNDSLLVLLVQKHFSICSHHIQKKKKISEQIWSNLFSELIQKNQVTGMEKREKRNLWSIKIFERINVWNKTFMWPNHLRNNNVFFNNVFFLNWLRKWFNDSLSISKTHATYWRNMNIIFYLIKNKNKFQHSALMCLMRFIK